jgi:hypothetical protein
MKKCSSNHQQPDSHYFDKKTGVYLEQHEQTIITDAPQGLIKQIQVKSELFTPMTTTWRALLSTAGKTAVSSPLA